MGAVIAPVMLVVVVIVVGVILMKRSVTAQNETHDTLASDAVPSLRYTVPEGQDPAPVLAALSSAGYLATADPQEGDQGLLIGDVDGDAVDRESVRTVLAEVSAGDRPRFDDE